MPLLLLLISVRGFEHRSGEDPGSRGLREEDTGGAPHSGAPLTSISLPPSFHSKPSTEGTMIWKRSAVLRFYSVCGLLLQGNPRPAAGSINFMPVPHHPHSTPYFHSPPYSQSPSPWRFPPPPPTPRCGRGQWQFAPAPRISSAVSTLLSRQSAPYGHLSPFHSPELPTSLTLHHRQHQPPPHTHSHAFWLATCAFSEHSTLPPTPTSHLPHHAPDRPSPSLVTSLTSPFSGRLSLSPSSHHHHIRVPLKSV